MNLDVAMLLLIEVAFEPLLAIIALVLGFSIVAALVATIVN